MLRVIIVILAVGFSVSDDITECCFFNPTCGSDGELYTSGCELREKNKDSTNDVTAVDWNDCQVDCDQISCTREYSPYCGSDDNIYSNLCVLLHASCGKTEKILVKPFINCVEKKCPDNCDDNDTECKSEVESCRAPWKERLLKPE